MTSGKTYAILRLVSVLTSAYKGLRLVIKAVGFIDGVIDEYERETAVKQAEIDAARKKMSEIYQQASNNIPKSAK